MSIEEALFELGVRSNSLAESEAARLDNDGFVILEHVLSEAAVSRLRERSDELLAQEGADAGKEVHQEAGTARLADLVNKDPLFDQCFTHPRVLAGIFRVLGTDFKLSSLNSRAALPGAGLQSLHVDWHEAVGAGEFQVCNSIWLLDDFTAENGATRVVPGSHRSGLIPSMAMVDPSLCHPNEVLLTGPAGSVVIFNSHTWHGGTLNRTTLPRRALHAYFCRRELPAQLDQRRFLRPATFSRLTPAARYVLGVANEEASADASPRA